jgi:hypothetical protein
MTQMVSADPGHPHSLQVHADLIYSLIIMDANDADAQRNVAAYRLNDVGTSAGMTAAPLGNALVLVGEIGVVRGGEADIRAGQQAPPRFPDMGQVGVYLDRQPSADRAAKQVGEVWVEGGLAADELDHGDVQRGGLIEDRLPVVARHEPVSSGRARFRIAVDALESAFPGQFKPEK